MSEVSRSPDERVLIVAPIGADAANIDAVLRQAGIDGCTCPNLSAAALEFGRGCAAVLLTEEALNYERYTDLSRELAGTPPWSFTPVVLIVSGGGTAQFSEAAATALGARSRLTIIERPVRAATLVSTLRSALHARRQQYQVRDLLAEREELLASLERKVAERTAKLQEANAELEAFSYSVSHDLRGPLRSMEGYARILCEDYASLLPEEGRRIAERITRSAATMDRLMLDVLALSRIGRIEMELEPVDLDPLIRQVIDEYPELSALRDELSIESPLGWVRGHKSSLVQCFANLLQNAGKFRSPDRPLRIRIATERRGPAMRLTVCDNGIGIEPWQHDRIFQIFERAGPADLPGTGIGLAIVKRAAERMKGSVGVDSTSGEGACFWLELEASGAPLR